MATLEKIRQRGVLIAIVIGLALFAFILGDFLNSGKSLLSKNQFEIAEVAGASIPYQEYQGQIEYMTEINKLFSGQSQSDEATQDRIMEQTWQQMIQKYVLSDEYKKLSIGVHPDEVEDMVVGNNIHPIIQQIFADPNTGAVNIAQLKNFLQNLDQDQTGNSRMYWLYIENEIIRERTYAKYNNLIQKGLYATNMQAKNSFLEKNRKVNLEYVVQKYNTVSDSLVHFTNADIEAYYKEHQNDFKQENTRDIAYVSFDVKPLEDDFKAAEFWINDIKSDFTNTADAIQFVNLNSDVPHPNKNFKESELDENIKDFITIAKIGDVQEPVFNGESYTLVKLANIVYTPDSVNVRHILIQPSSQTQGAYDQAKLLADSLLISVKSGSNFASLAKEFSSDQGSAALGGDLGWFPEGVMLQEFTDACFNNKKGDKVIVETQVGFHIIDIINQSKAIKKYQVANLVRNVSPSSKTYQYYYAQASQFAGMNKTLELFDQAVMENSNLTKRYANKLTENQKYISGLESPRSVVKWAFEGDVNEVSDVFDLGDSYIVAVITEAKEKGIAPLESVRTQITLEVKKEKKAEYIQNELAKVYTNSNFDQLANDKNLVIEEASNISFNSFAMAAAGIEPKVIGIAANGNKDDIYGPIKGNNGVYFIRITEVTEAEGTEFAVERTQLASSYKSREIYEAYEALKDISEIEDRRSKFY